MLQTLLKMAAASSALVLSALVISMTPATTALADDTELYSATYQAGVKGKPKVLIVFDDSGSMNEIVEGVKPAYNPNATYVEKVPPNRIYWSTTGNPPNVDVNPGRTRWFPDTANSCASSHTPLAQQGRFAGTPKRWQSKRGVWYEPVCEARDSQGVCTQWAYNVPFRFWYGTPAGWVDLSDGANNPYSVDCLQDVAAENPDNASSIADGYPRAAPSPDSPNTDAYTALLSDSNVGWGEGRSFFTSHYINWYYDDTIIPEDKDYLQIAQEVIESIIMAHPTIDFGLAVFNNNDLAIPNTDGGRVVKRIIKNMTADDRDDLVDTLWSLDHAGNTPLCETAWEAYLYMTGGAPRFANSADPSDIPLRDPEAESGSQYLTPMEECANTYIIFMTDGLPTADVAANADITNEIGGGDCRRTYSSIDPVFGDIVSFQNCLAPLTEYMADNDLNSEAEGTQSVKTATIGFNVDSRADDLLIDAATMTKSDKTTPAYYDTESPDDLVNSFTDILVEILSTETTFTSPAVAVDSFTRTQSRDDVFFAMFEPNASADWLGNIKKLKLKVINGEAVIVDAADEPAFDSQGLIKETARSYWSSVSDGPTVSAGGVGGVLRDMALNTRDIRTNTGADGALETFNTDNVDAAAYGMADANELHAFWLASDATDFADTLRWGWGYDVDDVDRDEDRDETRDWILADILHSKPLVINYGARGSHTPANPDLRIVVGTNNGLLHMFSNDDGGEDWAFFPKELGPVLAKRRKNIRNGKNVYGVDAPAVVYTVDVNQDGTLDHTAGDKVYLYFGLRRGGNLYYALDISNPENPAFLWSISPDHPGFGELGQSWSVPVVTRVPGYLDGDGKAKPVLVFGGGYDETKDDHTTLADTVADHMGRGLFIVDAITGALVWSVTPADDSATNMQETALVHSIAADVTTMDSNGDGLTDRIYLADTGGNVWRVDLPGGDLPTSSQDTWFITQLFDANDNTKTGDRRFFNAPDVTRTTFNGAPVDAVMIGSGDRTNPIAMDNPDDEDDPTVDDQFYMIRDQRTTPYVAARDCDDEELVDFRCELPIYADDLYDITPNLIQSADEDDRDAAIEALAAADGWRLDLAADGEKSLSRSLTIAGKLYFTTFTPLLDVTGCDFTPGNARLYVIDLLTGGEVMDFNGDDDEERYWPIGSLIPHTPSPYFGPDGEIWLLLPPGDSGEAKATGNPFETGATLPGPYGTYWNRGDY